MSFYILGSGVSTEVEQWCEARLEKAAFSKEAQNKNDTFKYRTVGVF